MGSSVVVKTSELNILVGAHSNSLWAWGPNALNLWHVWLAQHGLESNLRLPLGCTASRRPGAYKACVCSVATRTTCSFISGIRRVPTSPRKRYRALLICLLIQRLSHLCMFLYLSYTHKWLTYLDVKWYFILLKKYRLRHVLSVVWLWLAIPSPANVLWNCAGDRQPPKLASSILLILVNARMQSSVTQSLRNGLWMRWATGNV